MEFIEHLESGLEVAIRLVKALLEATAVLCVLLGFLKTGQLALPLKLGRGDRFPVGFVQLRLCFGMWLALALEFQLGADILSTTVTPTFEALGKLGAIATIRTVLNYFLNQEIEKEIDFKKRFERDIDREL
ncbi:MAG TPA: DUF1622 domain-containing protein [Oscillatoriales cyanobacterium M59_W2019_021]|nr:DUF1622 domain-containing protein [Oscillatoriales cyanobacterium M4454_W2019_049]HIK50687.1 DUF1622 domain-containing protein [Oscillatoriales cyanobacterium M59_W2019_021]